MSFERAWKHFALTIISACSQNHRLVSVCVNSALQFSRLHLGSAIFLTDLDFFSHVSLAFGFCVAHVVHSCIIHLPYHFPTEFANDHVFAASEPTCSQSLTQLLSDRTYTSGVFSDLCSHHGTQQARLRCCWTPLAWSCPWTCFGGCGYGDPGLFQSQ